MNAIKGLLSKAGGPNVKDRLSQLWMTGYMRSGTLRGVDAFGNKYYEAANDSTLKDRWVIYGNTKDFDASQIPDEWHGWLHHMYDVPVAEVRPQVFNTGVWNRFSREKIVLLWSLL